MTNILSIKALGQVGFLMEFNGVKLMIDPYLSDYVATLYGKELTRQVQIVERPEMISDLDAILITHEHEDHCDPMTLESILANNNDCTMYCPKECNDLIKISDDRKKNLQVGEIAVCGDFTIKGLPASHTSLEITNNYSRWMGYELKIGNFIMYHAGDTIPFGELKSYLNSIVDLAFLPINERNYFRDRDGIIGNMTCREAILWVEELNIKKWIPTHWDMFKPNNALKEELQLISESYGINKHLWLEAGDSIEIAIE